MSMIADRTSSPAVPCLRCMIETNLRQRRIVLESVNQTWRDGSLQKPIVLQMKDHLRRRCAPISFHSGREGCDIGTIDGRVRLIGPYEAYAFFLVVHGPEDRIDVDDEVVDREAFQEILVKGFKSHGQQIRSAGSRNADID